MDALFVIMGALVVVGMFLASAIRIAQEYERGVIFRLGRLAGMRGPGFFFLIPLFERERRIDTRVITWDVRPQDVITRDNISIKIDAVLYFRVSDPIRAVIEVTDFMFATSEIAQTSLRGIAGQATLDEILSERAKINAQLHQIIDEATDRWGIKVTAVEIKHVELPEAMQRAIAKQAEAERMRRAKIILAEGEYQAAEKLKAAGDILQADPIIFRYLETIAEAAKEKNTTILFPAEMLGMARRLFGKEQ